ncbi:MAG: COG3014 family protein [Limisphaerales bacterium]
MNDTSTNPESRLRLCLALVVLVFGAGCQTYTSQNLAASGSWLRGDVQSAVGNYSARARKAPRRDAVIWNLELGTAHRSAGGFRASNDAYGSAESLIDHWERRAKVSVSQEAVALVSNQASLPYEGRIYDKIMLNSYRGLNFLQLGNEAGARVEFNRVLRRQEDAVAIKKRQIARDERAITQARGENRNGAAMLDDSRVQSRLDSAYSHLDTYRARGTYENPFAIFMRGLFFATHANGNSDLETARHALNQVVTMTGNNYVKRELQHVEEQFQGKTIGPMVHVVFETGRAPQRGEQKIELPLFFLGDGNVPLFAAAFPTLRPQYNYISSLKVDGGGHNAQSVLLADMDAIIAREFLDELPTIQAKTILSSVGKAAAGYAINRSAKKQDKDLGLFAVIATSIYQAAVNVADTRTWTTLPKQIQYCSLPLPADRKLKLSGAGLNSNVTLQNGNTLLIYVKSISPEAPLLVTQTTLN